MKEPEIICISSSDESEKERRHQVYLRRRARQLASVRRMALRSPNLSAKDEDIDGPMLTTPNATTVAPMTSTLATTETPVTETPVTETPTMETPATETPATETPATETPTMETLETPTMETPTMETPVTETPTMETPATEMPATETPATETPTMETLETPTMETPTMETPVTETPTMETPATETLETPTMETPTMETPVTETPTMETPATEMPATETPTMETPATQKPAMSGMKRTVRRTKGERRRLEGESKTESDLDTDDEDSDNGELQTRGVAALNASTPTIRVSLAEWARAHWAPPDWTPAAAPLTLSRTTISATRVQSVSLRLPPTVERSATGARVSRAKKPPRHTTATGTAKSTSKSRKANDKSKTDIRTLLFANRQFYSPNRDQEFQELRERFEAAQTSGMIAQIMRSSTPTRTDQAPVRRHSPPPLSSHAQPSRPTVSSRPTSRPTPTGGDGETYLAADLIPAVWPNEVMHLSSNFNPLGIEFTYHARSGYCNCTSPCRTNTCPNNIQGLFCNLACCLFKGKCGNGVSGLSNTDRVRLRRYRGTQQFAVVAVEPIEAHVVIGEYLGELTFERARGSERTPNEGYRFYLHRDDSHRSDQRVCINALKCGGLMRFVNHSCSPSADFLELSNGFERRALVVTRRPIAVGEEVTVNYGSDLWFTCRCGICCRGRTPSRTASSESDGKIECESSDFESDETSAFVRSLRLPPAPGMAKRHRMSMNDGISVCDSSDFESDETSAFIRSPRLPPAPGRRTPGKAKAKRCRHGSARRDKNGVLMNGMPTTGGMSAFRRGKGKAKRRRMASGYKTESDLDDDEDGFSSGYVSNTEDSD